MNYQMQQTNRRKTAKAAVASARLYVVALAFTTTLAMVLIAATAAIAR